MEKLERELKILESLDHPHIVRCLGHESTKTHLIIQLEYASGGSVASMVSEFGPLSSAALQTATTGILSGLEYLHTRPVPVVHRDVKGANVLVMHGFVVKLADFGCSKSDQCTKSLSTMGSIHWMAPEVINQKEGHGRKADVWSFGCTIIEMATGEKPWGNQAFNNFMYALNYIGRSGNTPPVPASTPTCCQDLIRLCTRLSQDERPSSSDLLAHPYISPRAAYRSRDVTL